eukprot:SAG31_NODE_1781_length_7282_cov_1.770291_7_plen_71_part_00
MQMLDKYVSDSFRFYLCRFPYGSDLPFSEDGLVKMSDSDLADTLGNYANRALALCKRYCGSKVHMLVFML